MTHLSLGLVRADILTSEYAIKQYSVSGVKELKGIAAYHIQQAFEKLLKMQVLSSTQSQDANIIFRTHNLSKIIKVLLQYNKTAYIPEYLRKNAILISSWEVSGRYDTYFSVSIEELTLAWSELFSLYSILSGDVG